MKPISIYRPSSIEEAIQILSLHGTQAGVYAGGTDLLIQLKNRIEAAPTFLVDIKKIDGLRYIKEDGQGGVQIGALTKLAELAGSDLLAKKYPMLVDAVQHISSPELRNASTIGGDMLQQVCGANTCAADIPATAMGDISAMARLETTAITTRLWADDCATPCTQETLRRP
jgi:CO/xanthine dehydrogenase FAD-binding subunit